MEIAQYEIFDVPPFWKLIRIETTEGLIRWGKASNPQQEEAITGAINTLMKNYVSASSAERIEDIWQQMYRGLHSRRGPPL